MAVVSKAAEKSLPKASLLKIDWWTRSMWTRFRLANAHQLHFGKLVILFRARWLESPARQIHPEAFTDLELESK